MFMPYRGQWKFESIPSGSQQAYAQGELLQNTGGANIAATSTSLHQVGICLQTVASGTANRPVLVAFPQGQDCTMLGDIGSGTPAVANRNTTCDLVNSLTVAHGTDTHHQLTIRGYISATVGEYSINSMQFVLPAA
jgi:hypothetical protein